MSTSDINNAFQMEAPIQSYETQENLIFNIKYLKCKKSLNELIKRYEAMLNIIKTSAINKYSHTPLDKDDMWSIVKQNFVEVIFDFDETRGTSFAPYAKKYTGYKINTYIRKFLSRNHQILNFCNQQILENSVNAAESQIIDHYNDEIEEIIQRTKLTREEKIIIREYELGTKIIRELALMLGCSEKRIYYLREKAIKKLSKTAQSII